MQSGTIVHVKSCGLEKTVTIDKSLKLIITKLIIGKN